MILGCGSHHPESRAALDDPPMNLILIVLDTFRGDIPSYAGGEADTPHLDALAHRGVWFRNARAHAPLTGPSHASLFTSLYSSDHGVFENGQVLGAKGTTLAELMRERGYLTSAFVSLGVMRAEFGFNRGFDSYADDFTNQWWKNASEMNADILPWIERAGDQPFFLWLHYSDTHGPYTPPDQQYPELHLMQNGDVIGRIRADGRIADLTVQLADHQATVTVEPGSQTDAGARFEVRIGDEIISTCRFDATRGFVARQAGTNNVVLDIPAELSFTGCDLAGGAAKMTIELTVEKTPEGNRRAYLQEAEYLDGQLGMVLHRFETLGKLDNTVIVVAGDHGEGLGDHGVFKHGRQLYDSLVRVPLIISAPGVLPEGQVVESSVSLVDVVPTVIELMSLQAVPGIRGRSLVPLINQETTTHHPGVSRAFHSNGKFNLESVTLGSLKYIRDINTGDEELYDLDRDPGEVIDLAAERPTEVAAMRSLLASTTHGPAATGSSIVDDEVRRQLRALGYEPSDED